MGSKIKRPQQARRYHPSPVHICTHTLSLPPLFYLFIYLLQRLGRVALVWRDQGAVGDLLVRVRGEDDEVGGVVDHGEGGLISCQLCFSYITQERGGGGGITYKTIARAKLAAPARRHRVDAARGRAAVGLVGERRGRAARDDLGARGDGGAVVDAKGPHARGEAGVAGPGEAGDGPRHGVGHHGLGLRAAALLVGGDGEGGGGREEGGDDEVLDLHGDGSGGWVMWILSWYVIIYYYR